jgi:hypothetical protein
MPAPDVLAGAHRRDEVAPSRLPIIIIACLTAIGVGTGVWATTSAGQVEDDRQVAVEQRDAAAAQGADLARQVLEACGRGEIVQSPDGRNLCEQASTVQATPVPVVPPQVIEGAPGRPPTPAEIEAAVSAYLVANPPAAGRPPSEAEVAAAVAQYLTANPPEPGRPPTAAEIAAAVETYFADNPPPRGPAGSTGERGPGPTPEEIRAAVDAYLAENPPPRGPAGPPCPAGTTLREVVYGDGARGLGCVLDEQPTPSTTVQPEPTTTSVPEPTTEDG